ncbi:MAG: hypothetical protein U0528_07940 [Anaerolineae bacterium]|nr:hypothetical protein [Anaerolineae bacterium]
MSADTSMTASIPAAPDPDPALTFRERHLARLLLTLYYSGTPISSLFEGETRQVDSPARIHRFDFWMREPGHLALALIYATAQYPVEMTPQRDAVIAALTRMTDAGALDVHRVAIAGSYLHAYADLDEHLAYLTSTALLTDRPSFTKGQQSTHQIVLETPGIALVQKILAECPAYAWYKAQAEIIALCLPALEKIDVNTMPYLAPDLTPALAAVMPLTSLVSKRAALSFGELR